MSSSRLDPRALLAATLWAPAALAYIDPGTGGLIVGGLGMVLAWGAVALVFLRKLLLRAARGTARLVARHPKIVAGVLVLLAAGAVLLRWRESPMSTASAQPARFDRVLALGIDGADPRLIQALFDEGLLPNLKRVAEQGSFRHLEIPNPAQSPVVWATLATGQNPGRNGIFDFIGRDPEKYLPKLSLLAETGHGGGYRHPIRAKAFWDVTTEHQLPAVVLRWPMTFPPRKIHGRMLAGLGVPDVRGSLGRYTFFTDRAPPADEEGRDKVTVVTVQEGGFEAPLAGPQVRTLGGVKPLTVPLKVKLDPAARSALVTVGGQAVALGEGQWSDWVELTFQGGLFSKYRGLVRLHLASVAEPVGLLATSVEMHPEAPVVPFSYPASYSAELRQRIGLFHTLGMPEDTKAYGEGRMSEEAFLELCRKVEGERRAMLLHELETFERGVLAVVFDTLDRIQHMTAPSEPLATSAAGRYLVELDRYLGTVLDRVRPGTAILIFSDHGFSEFDQSVDLNRWLVEAGELAIDEAAYRGRPAGSSGELFRYVRWDQTRAYAVGFSGVYVNVRGREGKGIVAPEERQKVAAEVAARLRDLTDPRTGAPVVHRVYPREEVYRGELAEEAPDLVIGYRPGFRGSWQSAVGGLSETVLAVNDKRWRRDHIVDASFVDAALIANFRVHAERPRAQDLAPTIVGLLGLPLPEEFEGRPLHVDPERLADARERR